MDKRGEFYTGYSGEEMNDRMNDWKEELISPADTYIEWKFECKCKHISNGYRIITEWRKRKLQYIAVMRTIIMDFQHYSRHDESHSICILERIEQLLGKQRIDLLSAGDLWLLLEAAYSHDIGMAMTHEQLIQLVEKDGEFLEFVKECIEDDLEDVNQAALFYKEMDNLLHDRKKLEELDGKEDIVFTDSWPIYIQMYFQILVAEYIRRNHAKRAEKLFGMMDTEMETIIPYRLYRVVTLISQLHGEEFGKIFQKVKYSANGFGSGMVHPQFAAAMLRIGDLLDIDNNRFDPYAVRHFGRLPLVSMRHWDKHKAVTHICVSESEISAEAGTADDDVALLTDEWFRQIDREVESLICAWNEIAPEALRGCTLKKSTCKVFLNHLPFDSGKRKEFTINKKKIINLLIGTNIYKSSLDFFREYIQNAMDATKMQFWMDLKGGKYDLRRNPKVLEYSQLTPFDVEKGVYDNYDIRITVQWNEQFDMIKLQIEDRGIGIEQEYFEKLSNIGTGWRGRERYKKELHKMPKWLQPTGGFGIGIQSAFMVTDFVEVYTKSDYNLHGYYVKLESPDKGGKISVREDTDIRERGTRIVFEIEPERFQGWMEYLKGQDEFFWGKYSEYEYDFSIWDEFDDYGNLDYARSFIEKYVKSLLPNPLFQVYIRNADAKDGKSYKNEHWPAGKYWDKENGFWHKERSYDNKRYLILFDEIEEKRYYFWVWDREDCVLTRIDSKGEKEKAVCFKNVVVRDADKELLDLFCQYSVCIDFMGFHVDNCLKLHRNSFQEKFHWERYCYEAFRGYLYLVWERFHKSTGKGMDEKNTEFETFVEEEWKSYRMQLIRLLAFPDMFDDTYEIEENKDDDDNDKNKVEIQKAVLEKAETNVNVRMVKASIKKEEVLRFLETYLKGLRDVPGQSGQDAPLLLLGEGEEYRRDKDNETMISPASIQRWAEGRREEGEADGDSQEYSERDAVQRALVEGMGIIKDKDTARMLLSDVRFYTDRYRIKGWEDPVFYLLKAEQDSPVISDDKFWSGFFGKTNVSRQYVKGKNADRYPQLKISALPFRSESSRTHGVYLLFPISKKSFLEVQKSKEQNRKLDYDDFRKIVWGVKGEERSEYRMLINWVVKHQVKSGRYTREVIVQAYETFLTDLYKEYILGDSKGTEI